MFGKAEIGQVFARRNAIITGDHFVYAKKADGWYHGTDYVNKDAIYPYVDDVEALCEVIADHFRDQAIDVVIGPTVGAVSLAQWTTKWLHRFEGNDRVLAVCADEEDVLEPRELVVPTSGGLLGEFSASGLVKVEGLPDHLGHFGSQVKILYQAKVGTRRVVKRGYDQHVRGKRCLLVEDIINTGITVGKTSEATAAAGGIVVGCGCLCNRSGGKVTAASLGLPELFGLLDVNMKMVKEEECPTCREKGRGSVRLDLGKGKDFLARMGIQPGDR